MEQKIRYEGFGGVYEVTVQQMDSALKRWGSLDMEELRALLVEWEPESEHVFDKIDSMSALLVIAAWGWTCPDCGAVPWLPHCH